MRAQTLGLSLLVAFGAACTSNPNNPAPSTGTGTGGASSGGSSSGSSTGSADLIDGGIPEGANAWATSAAQFLCGAIFGCPATALGGGAEFQDEASCVAAETSFWLSTYIEPQPGESTTATARLEQGQLCLSDLLASEDAGACAADLPFLIQDNQPEPASCQAGAFAVAGTLSQGAPCISPLQCSSRRCEQSSGCGVCGPPSPHLDGGTACEQYDDCASGLICTGGRCRTFIPNGQSCKAGDLCAPLTSCIDSICQPTFLPGQACTNGSTTECQAQECQNSACAAIPIAPIGSICGYTAQLQSYVLCDTATSVCDIVDTTAQVGYCIARKAIGDRCFVSKGVDGDDCVADASCLGGRCESPYAACLSDGGIDELVADAGPVALPDASGDFAAVLAAAEQGYSYVCEGVANCPTLAADLALFGGSASTCEAGILPALEAALNLAGTNPSSGAAAQTACNAELATLDPCLAATILTVGYDSPACAGLAGTLPAGAACASVSQCTSGNCSTYWAGSGCGVCGNVLDAGAQCNAASDCAGSQACAEGVCVPWGQYDAGCSPSAPCAPQFVCVNGNCSGGLPEGSSCSPSEPLCNPNLFCNAKTDACEAQIVANADAGMNDAGEFDCGYVASGSYALCPFGSACQLTNTTLYTGSCVPAGAPGSPCTSTGSWTVNSGNCNWPSSCVDGVCGIPPTAVCE